MTYRQRQLVTLFVFLARQGRAGATRRDAALALQLSTTSGYVRTLLDVLVRCRIVSCCRDYSLPHTPFRYYAHDSAWQV